MHTEKVIIIKFNYDNMNAGITPDGTHQIHEAKVMICYLLSASPQNLSRNQLQIIFAHDGIMNYFILTQTLRELKESKHISVISSTKEDEIYKIEDTGHEAANKLSNDLPFTIKEKIIKAATELVWNT